MHTFYELLAAIGSEVAVEIDCWKIDQAAEADWERQVTGDEVEYLVALHRIGAHARVLATTSAWVCQVGWERDYGWHARYVNEIPGAELDHEAYWITIAEHDACERGWEYDPF